jgi:hypothetical protein
MRLSTRLLSAAALTGVAVLGGAPAAAALPGADVYTKTVHRSGFGEVTAHCPTGYRVTGGGVAVDHKEEITTLHSRPTQDGRGWEGMALGETERPEKDGAKAEEKKAEADAKDGAEADDELGGLPLTVYAVCSL